MRIAHIESSMNWGGQELRVVEQTEWLNQNGHPAWIVARPGAAILEKAQEKKLPIHELKMRGSAHPRTFLELRKFLLTNQIDLLDCHGNRDASYGALVKWFTRIAVIRSRHITEPIRLNAVRRFIWKRGHHGVIVTAGKIRDMLSKENLVPSPLVSVAIAGVDERRFHPGLDGTALRRKLGIPLHHKVIANVCMIRPDKGVHHFAGACRDLIARYPDITCVQIGEATRQTQRYKQSVMASMQAETGSGRFRFLGYQSDIENWLAIADIVVIASVGTEAQTRLVSQAFMMNKNIVASTIGGLPEMIAHEETGLLCEPDDPAALTGAIERLLVDADLCQTLQENAYRHSQQHMTFSAMMDGMLKAYEAALERNS